MKIRVFTHTDLDGYGVLLSCMYAFGKENVEWSKHGYDGSLDKTLRHFIADNQHIKYDLVIIGDICPEEEELLEWINDINEVGEVKYLLFDHHETRAELIKNYEWAHYHPKRSGTWQVYNHLREIWPDWEDIDPKQCLELMTTIDMYDTWQKSYQIWWERGELYTNLLSSIGFHAMLDAFYLPEDISEIANTLARGLDLQNKEKIESAIDDATFIPEFNAVLINARGNHSVVGHKALEKYPKADYAIILCNRSVSLRSRDDGPNVATIAEKLGGGGHEHAAGFSITKSKRVEIIKLLMNG